MKTDEYKRLSLLYGYDDFDFMIMNEYYEDDGIQIINENMYVTLKQDTYYFGIELTPNILVSNPDYNAFNEKIRSYCYKLGLVYTKPQFHYITQKN